MTTAQVRDLEDARTAAIDASGWGAPLRVVQLRNACFWLLLWGLAMGTLQMVKFFAPGVDTYGAGLGVGVIAFSLYTIPWLFLLSHHNRYTSLPAKLFMVAFGWGGLAATFGLALPTNTAMLSLYGKAFGHGWARDWAAGLTAPFTEETAKAMALVLLIGLAPRLVRSPYDGLMIGAFTGLGFQIFEDVLYAYNSATTGFGTDQTSSAVQVVLLRSLSGVTGHVLFSAVFCAGLMWLLGRGQERHWVRGLLLMAAAMVAHGVWDDSAAIGMAIAGTAGLLLFYGVVPVAELLLLWLTFRLTAPQERDWLHQILAPETTAGVLTTAEVQATGGGRARRAYLKTLHHRRQKRTGKHILTAATDLAHQLAISNGHTTAAVDHARAEITRLRTPDHQTSP